MTDIVRAIVLTAGFVAQATGGRVVAGDSARVFDEVSTDSRTATAGALFIALVGERFDAHDFVDDTLARGVGGLLVSERPSDARGATVIIVPDTLVALQALGHAVRLASGARVVAITGSAGKTTTKELTAAILATRYDVFRNRGNFNNHIGLPLSLLELRSCPDVAVLELGMNHAGEIHRLVEISAPDVRVWTNVGDAHVGYLGSREAVARAKAELLDGATVETVVVANADDPYVMAHIAKTPARVVTFGDTHAAIVQARNVRDRGLDGTFAEVVSPAGVFAVDVPLPGRAQLANALAAIAVAIEFGVPPSDIQTTVRAFRPVERRGSSTMLKSGVRLVDDSYNASPAAVVAMLAALAATETSGRRIAVLGEMRELGDASLELHEACGDAVASAGVDELVAVGGPAADGFVTGALRGGLASAHVHRFSDSASAAPAVAALVRSGDIVLVKGSRGTKTDIIADRLGEVA